MYPDGASFVKTKRGLWELRERSIVQRFNSTRTAKAIKASEDNYRGEEKKSTGIWENVKEVVNTINEYTVVSSIE